ncbi:VanZ family protein [Anoxybacillus calidus]|uniref:VanZ family protein n=1 Tax=[Anoxybacillus] calidus TaxID=575178 RepID=A0A7V9YZB6_9BACL|nr:VanZ family protein [Anoxybacillus calidus]MBA2871229.1 VanZ family protein [Anoxybacillus calidus]
MKNKWLSWALVLLWCALIYYFSESPTFTGENTAKVINHIVEAQPPEATVYHHHGFSFSWNFVVRKFAHLSAFGILAFLVWKALVPHRLAYVGAWSFATVYAMTDEWHQSFQPGRTALVSDVVIDACGAALALLFVRIYLRMKRS